MYYICTVLKTKKMISAYTMQFESTNTGKLKCSLFFNNKYQQSKTFPIYVTKEDLRNPPIGLENMLMGIKSKWNELVIDHEITGRSPISRMFQSKYAETKTPFAFFSDLFDYRLKKWMNFIDKDLSWGDITDSLINDYHTYLETEDVANSTIRSYLQGLKKSLDDAKLRGYRIASSNYASLCKASASTSISIFLTMSELRLIEEVELPEKWDAVRVKFLIGAYTGARYSDFSKLTTADISSGELRYVAEKTGALSYVPVHSKLPELLAKYSDSVSNAQMNIILPKIGEKAGINTVVTVMRGDEKETGEKWNYIKSHTARRTFATNLYISGCNILDVSRMLGHASVVTTQKYIATGVNNSKLKELSFFNN